jgi:subtilisin family serine protease
MKKVKSIIKLLFIAAIVAGLCAPAFAFPPPKPVPGQFIVIFKEAKIPPATKLMKIQAKNRDEKIQMSLVRRQEVLNKINSFNAKNKIQESAILNKFGDVIAGYSAKLSQAELIKLRGQSDVEGVYQDFEMFLGPVPVSTTAPSDVNAQSQYLSCAVAKAGGPYLGGSAKQTKIWILDTGIDLNHPDLNVDLAHARSFVPGQTPEDGYGHGTHCAGIAAAKNNGFGVVGVSAGAKVVPVKVLSNAGTGYFSWIISGLNYVAGHDIPGDVVSMSLGGYPMPCNVGTVGSTARALAIAIWNLSAAGTHVVMAAGNNGQCNGAAQVLPGCINQFRAYTVGALNCDLTRASYSNFGAPVVDWVAVGTDVWSTYKNGGYAMMSGTSMATPVVAGIIHARGGPPVPAGTKNICGVDYKVAHR